MVYDPVMEKRKPTYDLAAFQAAFAEVANLYMTTSAVTSAAGLGFSPDDIVATIQSMRWKHFYKSMTSYKDYRV